MATVTPNPSLDEKVPLPGISASAWPRSAPPAVGDPRPSSDHPASDSSSADNSASDLSIAKPSQRDALQALLAFSALHDQVRRRKALAVRQPGFDAAPAGEFEQSEQFVLDEVLQLVAERGVAITGADGLAIALAENDEIVLRAAAGVVRPDIGARIDRDSAFSGASFRAAQVIICDDTETDPRVNLQACRKLGARAMVAVPLCGRRRVIGLLEAFSTWPFGFNDSDVRNLTLLAELVVGALRPEDEDRFAESARVATTNLESATKPAAPTAPSVPSSSGIAAAPAIPVPQTTAKLAIEPKPAAEVPLAAKPAVRSFSPAVAPSIRTQSVLSQPIPTQQAAQPAQDVRSLPIPDLPKIEKVTPSESRTVSQVLLADAAVAEPTTADAAPAEAAIATATAPVEPALTFGQLQPEPRRRPAMLIVLLAIVVVAAFIGGVWWKLKLSEVGSALVTGKAAQTALLKASPAQTPAAPQASATAAQPTTGSANAAPATDATADTSDLATPATPQELAKFPRVTAIRHWSSADSSTIVLDLEDQVQYESHRLSSPDRIYFDLRDTQLAADLANKTIDIGDSLLARARVAQPVAGVTRLVLETKAGSDFSVSLEPNPYRFVVEVRKLGATPKAVNLFPNADTTKKLAIVVPPPSKEDLQLRARVPKLRIVVDAGHGGWDLGTVGRRGLLEKDLVLEIAERLGKLLESRLGADVIYTRVDDNYIPLDERAEIANQAQADLFISVHANYSDLPSARGVETYYSNSFSAPGSKESKDAGATLKPVAAPSLSPADLHERTEQSRRLAASVQRSLYGTLSANNPGLRDRGVKEAAFVVLTESAMPGILAEVSFVSSPTDEQKLRSDGYREEIAEALYRGVARYAASSKGLKVASTGK
jgi:N-acetylmuramoyl-L-alanine amidase